MITHWISANWENLLKALPVIAGAIYTIYQIKGKLPESRSQLKLDLEILELLPEKDDPSHKLLKDSIDARIAKLYFRAAPRNATDEIELEDQSLTRRLINWIERRIIDRIRWREFIYGLILLLVFGLWTVSLYNRHNWWALLTGFVAFGGGIGNLMLAFEARPAPTSESTEEPPPEEESTSEDH